MQLDSLESSTGRPKHPQSLDFEMNMKAIPDNFFLADVSVAKGIFTALLDQLPREPTVKTITMDFESAVWSTLRALLPDVELRGCSFHLTQAVWRKMQELGLQAAYHKKAATYNFCRRLMALQFLPAEYITTQFEAMEASGAPPTINRLLAYYRSQWIDSRVFPVAAWSVFNREVRTNNDVEGWHHRFNNIKLATY